MPTVLFVISVRKLVETIAFSFARSRASSGELVWPKKQVMRKQIKSHDKR